MLFAAAICCANMVATPKFDGLKELTSGGKERQYYLYVPECLTANRPLIISCHGMNQDYKYMKDNTQWPSMADTANFVVVYPVGIAGSAWGNDYDTGWDVQGMSDVNFMMDIVAAVKAEYQIDDTRVYMSGFSLGGAFVYHVANKAANKFAAFAPISGYNIVTANTATDRPVPIIHVHGTNDNIMLYSGIKDYIKAWAQAQNCDLTPIETTGSGYSCMRYKDGDNEVEVVLYSVNGRSHEPLNTDGFHTSNAIWNFCKHYSTAGKIATDIKITRQKDKGQSTKVIRNGRLLIEREGKTYTVTGAVMER